MCREGGETSQLFQISQSSGVFTSACRKREDVNKRSEAMTLAVMPALKKIHSQSLGPLAMVDRLHQSSNLKGKQVLHMYVFQWSRMLGIFSPVLSSTPNL
jgi:hypothetical protein